MNTNPHFWDCECPSYSYYIHPKSQLKCPICKVGQYTQPDSIQVEVKRFVRVLWWGNDTHDTHASVDGIYTLCGTKIPTVYHPAPKDEHVLCRKCKKILDGK